jgi:soluble cytochrome b562
MKKFVITEEERKHIMGLYEQTTTGTTETNVEPDFRYIKTAKRTLTGVKEVTPTEQDYEDYRRGFNNFINGIKPRVLPIPSNEIRGAKEAKERNLKKK